MTDPIGETTPETARALLWRHGLPEDVIDGALALFAQELAGKIRAHRDHARGAVQATKVMDFAAELISPEHWARTVPAVPVSSPPPDQTAVAVCRFEEGCHRVVPCDPGCAVAAAELHHRLAVLPPPADRAAVLLEVADRLKQKADALTDGVHDLAMFVAKARIAEAEILDREAAELRRLAAEAQQQPDTETPTCPDPIECAHEAALGQAQQQVKRVRDVCDQLRRASVLADGEPHTDRERGIVQAVTRVMAALDKPAAGSGRVAAEARPETVCSESVARIADDEEG